MNHLFRTECPEVERCELCLVAAAVCAALSVPVLAQPATTVAGTIVEFPVAYPGATSVETGACHPAPAGSTHEITFDADGGRTLWITGQNYDSVVEVTESGAMTFHAMPEKPPSSCRRSGACRSTSAPATTTRCG